MEGEIFTSRATQEGNRHAIGGFEGKQRVLGGLERGGMVGMALFGDGRDQRNIHRIRTRGIEGLEIRDDW